MTVWVTGASGMLGTEVVAALKSVGGTHTDAAEAQAATLFATDQEVDITSREAVSSFWDRAGSIDWVVNCAAYTAVDQAEDDEDAAFRLNALGPQVLAAEAARRGAALVHISTDYVFDGRSARPYVPGDIPNPHGAYGRTKLGGERAVTQELDRHVVIRTAWLYGIAGKNFVYTMLRLMGRRDEIAVVDDQRGAPTYAPDLASAIATVVTHRDPAYGIYHYTNAGETTWFGFAQTIQALAIREGLLDSPCLIKPVPSELYPTPAPRPAYSVLDLSAIRNAYGIEPPAWEASLARFIQRIPSERSG